MANGIMTGAARINPMLQSFLKARKEQIRRGAGLLQRQATRAAASKGIMTSGVSEIPAAPIRQQRLASEAQAVGDVAMRQFGEEKLDQRRAEDFARKQALLRLQADLAAEIEKRRAKGQLTSALISGGLGLGAGYFKGGS